MDTSDAGQFNQYVSRLEKSTNISINDYDDYLVALKNRHDYFALNGCRVSDHGLAELYSVDYTENEVAGIFARIRTGAVLNIEEQQKFMMAMLAVMAEWDHEKGWIQQYHLGALRNNNSRMLQQLGPDTGWDSIGDYRNGQALAKFLNRLDKQNKLTRTILYNLNPSDNEMMATMIGNFNDGTIAGKIQWGAAWWFLDQKDGIRHHLDVLSNMGLVSRFVGMLTDSRSFLSFPRHEYFRRILCSVFGKEMEDGELPDDIEWIGKVIQDICHNNTKEYFGW